LTAIPHANGLPSVGLLLSEKEMVEFTPFFYPTRILLWSVVLQCSICSHGRRAAHGFVQTIATHGWVALEIFEDFISLFFSHIADSRAGQLYAWDRSAVVPRDLLDLLKPHAPIFMTGVAHDDDLKDLDERMAPLCGIDQGHIVAYFFASPLHRWYVEWKLSEMLPAFSIQACNTLNFVITVRLAAEGRMGPKRNPTPTLPRRILPRLSCLVSTARLLPESGIHNQNGTV